LLRPRSITTYQVQSDFSGYKLKTALINHLYTLYQNEQFVLPVELIYMDNVGTNPSQNRFDAIKQFKFTHVKEVCILFQKHVSDNTVQFNPHLVKFSITVFNHDYPDKGTNTTGAKFLRN
jgi:hypothetical protein